MKKIFIFAFFTLFLISFTSATIVVNNNLESTYNLGDTITLQIKLSSETNVDETKQFKVDLLCDGSQINIHDGPEQLLGGQEKTLEKVIPFIKPYISNTKNSCKIRISFGDEIKVLDDEFAISDKIIVTTNLEKTEFSPGETVIIQGDAIKEGGNPVQGFVEVSASITNSSSNIDITDTIKNGYFYIEIPLEETAKAGEYNVNINAYETNSEGEKTNRGYASTKFNIIQIPTSLEIFFEENEVEPGTIVKAKTILHDQTGDKMDSVSIMTIKDQKNSILEQTEKATDEYLEYEIPYNQPPANWTVVAISNKLNAQSTFKIKEKKDIEIEILNETLKITNKGNTFYNGSVLVKIGEQNLYLDITLEVDESKEFILTAPKGEYQIEVIAEGEETLTKNVLLTGRSIDIKESSAGVIKIMQHPFVWIFITGIFVFGIFILFKKKYPAEIISRIKSKKKDNKLEDHKKDFNSLLNFKKNKEKKIIEGNNQAELSLSIKGTKQETSIVCLKIKNFEEVDTSKIQETMQKIAALSEEKKAIIYENQDNLFFLFVPVKTRTFKNEKSALELAQKIKKILTEHNKLFKQKIEFGISVNQGEIIVKIENSILKFMSLGAIMNTSKKIAYASEEEILLDEKIKNKLTTSIKAEKKEIGNLPVYSIKEIKKLTDNKKFLENFVEKMKQEKRF